MLGFNPLSRFLIFFVPPLQDQALSEFNVAFLEMSTRYSRPLFVPSFTVVCPPFLPGHGLCATPKNGNLPMLTGLLFYSSQVLNTDFAYTSKRVDSKDTKEPSGLPLSFPPPLRVHKRWSFHFSAKKPFLSRLKRSIDFSPSPSKAFLSFSFHCRSWTSRVRPPLPPPSSSSFFPPPFLEEDVSRQV